MKSRRAVLMSILALVALFAGPSVADNDRGRNAAERTGDRRELRQDRQQHRDDLRDSARLEQLIGEHRAAAGDRAALAGLHREVGALLAAELGEAGRETAQAHREVRKDHREVRGDRREVRADRAVGAGPLTRLDDRHDLNDDRRDLRDDRRDAAAEEKRRARYVELRARWNALDAAGDLEPRLAVLRELRELAGAELRSDAAERGEDRRELREDRRESREDRR